MEFPAAFVKGMLFFLLVQEIPLQAQKIKPIYDSLPAPPATKNRLFYLQRNIDRNAVIYQINYKENGQVNEEKPVKVYWLKLEENGKISPLTYAQNTFAYGITSELIDRQKNIFKLNLAAYKKIDLYLQPGKNGRYEVHVAISGKPAILTNIWVNMTGGTYLKPVVSYIELSGMMYETSVIIREKIRPVKN